MSTSEEWLSIFQAVGVAFLICGSILLLDLFIQKLMGERNGWINDKAE